MAFHLKSVALALLFLLAFPGGADAASIDGIRLWQAPERTRLVFDLSEPVRYRLIALKNPDRIAIDIPDSALKASPPLAKLKGSGIVNVRSGVRNGGDLRIVLDLAATMKAETMLLARSAGKQDRLVIDLYPARAAVAVKRAPDASGRRDIIVAIDAGHGGEDPGALGPRKLKEKDIVLAIARELEKRFARAPGYRPVMVRNGDYYVDLKRRREIASEHRADLFLSIHADAFDKPSAAGASVFALSQRGATSATARFLAAKENRADQVGGVKLGGRDSELASLLYELSMDANLNASLAVGSRVLQSMESVAHLHSRKIDQANFSVLRSPDIPSILIETGFISNPGEAKKLASKSHQRKLAGAIFAGASEFFQVSPPPGTLIASQRSDNPLPRQYVVSRGDTLSGIARRYDVSISQLRHHNGLDGNSLHVGQRLKIPST